MHVHSRVPHVGASHQRLHRGSRASRLGQVLGDPLRIRGGHPLGLDSEDTARRGGDVVDIEPLQLDTVLHGPHRTGFRQQLARVHLLREQTAPANPVPVVGEEDDQGSEHARRHRETQRHTGDHHRPGSPCRHEERGRYDHPETENEACKIAAAVDHKAPELITELLTGVGARTSTAHTSMIVQGVSEAQQRHPLVVVAAAQVPFQGSRAVDAGWDDDTSARAPALLRASCSSSSSRRTPGAPGPCLISGNHGTRALMPEFSGTAVGQPPPR